MSSLIRQFFIRYIALAFSAVLIMHCCVFADFHRSISEGKTGEVRRILKKDARLVNLKDELGRSPLQLAAQAGHLDLVNILINAGAQVNHTDRLKGYTALHYAAMHNHPKIILFLLSRRADPNMQDSEGNCPLHFCAGNGCVETVKILLEHRADVNAMNRKWRNPLHFAVMAGSDRKMFPYAGRNLQSYLQICELLLENGTFPMLKDAFEDTPATIAVRIHRNNLPFLENLLKLLELYQSIQ